MIAITILTVACTTGMLFLVWFLVAICGKDGRASHVVHVLPAWPQHDGGNETNCKIADQDDNRPVRKRRMDPAAKRMNRHDRGRSCRCAAIQELKSLTQRTREARKSIR